MGIAAGVFVSFSPLFGLHFIYAALVALVIRGNVLAAFLGTFFGNPLTFPLIAAVSYRTGLQIFGRPSDASVMETLKRDIIEGLSGLWNSLLALIGMGDAAWGDVAAFFAHVFWPYFVGGIGPGIIAGLVTYLFARPLVGAYQKRRRGALAGSKRRLHPDIAMPICWRQTSPMRSRNKCDWIASSAAT